MVLLPDSPAPFQRVVLVQKVLQSSSSKDSHTSPYFLPIFLFSLCYNTMDNNAAPYQVITFWLHFSCWVYLVWFDYQFLHYELFHHVLRWIDSSPFFIFFIVVDLLVFMKFAMRMIIVNLCTLFFSVSELIEFGEIVRFWKNFEKERKVKEKEEKREKREGGKQEKLNERELMRRGIRTEEGESRRGWGGYNIKSE